MKHFRLSALGDLTVNVALSAPLFRRTPTIGHSLSSNFAWVLSDDTVCFTSNQACLDSINEQGICNDMIAILNHQLYLGGRTSPNPNECH